MAMIFYISGDTLRLLLQRLCVRGKILEELAPV